MSRNLGRTFRIAIFLPSLRGGGAERVMVTLANRFSVLGYAVDMVAAKAEGPYRNDISDDVGVIDLNAPRVLRSLPGLIRYLRREKPAVMLSAMAHANVVALAARMIARVNTRVVVSEHNNFSISKANSSSWREHVIGHLMRWAYPRADRVIAVSAGVADDLAANIGILRSAIDVVYNPVVTENLSALSREEPSHIWLNPGQPPVVLGVGRLTAQKDFATLIKAFAQLPASLGLRLLILGEGECRPELETLVCRMELRDRVCLPGFVDNPFAIMSRARLFVVSSAWEGLSNVIIEAMACSTQVVSTDCPSGPAEILENGKWGQLVPVGDVGAMADAMVKTLDSQTHIDVACRAAEFNVEQAVEGYLKVLLPETKVGIVTR